MSAKLLYRIAAVVLLLFAAGHTFGILTFKPQTAEGLAVRDAMHSAHLVPGEKFTYENFYKGLGLTVSAELLFTAVAAWHLGSLAANGRRAGGLGWAMVALQVASLALCWIYFGIVQVIFSAVVLAAVAAGLWRAG